MRSFEHLNEFSLKEDCEDSKQKERRIESKRERKKNMKHVQKERKQERKDTEERIFEGYEEREKD